MSTIFRYAVHENTILNAIHTQLVASSEPDKITLWITTITTPNTSTKALWEPNRKMVNLLEMVKSYYFHPLTKGSNSLKDILPSILQ